MTKTATDINFHQKRLPLMSSARVAMPTREAVSQDRQLELLSTDSKHLSEQVDHSIRN